MSSRRGGGGGEYPVQDGFGWTNGVDAPAARPVPDERCRGGCRRSDAVTTLDWLVVALYFVLLFVVAIVATRRGGNTETADGFFLDHRDAEAGECR